MRDFEKCNCQIARESVHFHGDFVIPASKGQWKIGKHDFNVGYGKLCFDVLKRFDDERKKTTYDKCKIVDCEIAKLSISYLRKLLSSAKRAFGRTGFEFHNGYYKACVDILKRFAENRS